MNFSLANMNVTTDYLDYNITEDFYEYQITSKYHENIISSVVFIICCIGVPLNGIVIWLLGFQIKRNPFTVLILNLAIADFGFLILMIINCIQSFIRFIELEIHWNILFFLLNATYINGLFLLTAISVDRCVAVLFPIRHRCSRPKYLSSAVCAFLWIFSFLLFGIQPIMEYFVIYDSTQGFYLPATEMLCLLLITISTVILIIQICLKSKQIKHRRLLIMILITLLCFLILILPLYTLMFVTNFLERNLLYLNALDHYLRLSTPLKSTINPVIYFLAGRKKGTQTRENIKVILQRVFREDEAPEI